MNSPTSAGAWRSAGGADVGATMGDLAGAIDETGWRRRPGRPAACRRARPGGRLVGRPPEPISRSTRSGSGRRSGRTTTQRLANSSGLDISALLPLLAAFLPQIINMLTPEGKTPARWPERRARQRRARRPRWAPRRVDGRSHHRRCVGGGWIRQPRGRLGRAHGPIRHRRGSLSDESGSDEGRWPTLDACPCPFADSRQRSPTRAPPMLPTWTAPPPPSASNGSSRRNR